MKRNVYNEKKRRNETENKRNETNRKQDTSRISVHRYFFYNTKKCAYIIYDKGFPLLYLACFSMLYEPLAEKHGPEVAHISPENLTRVGAMSLHHVQNHLHDFRQLHHVHRAVNTDSTGDKKNRRRSTIKRRKELQHKDRERQSTNLSQMFTELLIHKANTCRKKKKRMETKIKQKIKNKNTGEKKGRNWAVIYSLQVTIYTEDTADTNDANIKKKVWKKEKKKNGGKKKKKKREKLNETK